MPRQQRKHIADFSTRLAPFSEAERRWHRRACHTFGDWYRSGQRFACILCQFRFRIERIDMGWAAIHEQVDKPARAWPVSGNFGSQWIGSTNRVGFHHPERQRAQSQPGLAQKATAIRKMLHAPIPQNEKGARAAMPAPTAPWE